MMIEGVENRAFHFNFHWQRAPRLKKLWTLTQAASIESVSLRRLVGAARDSLWRGARLEANGPNA